MTATTVPSTEATTPKKGFLRSLFAAAAPGVLAAGALAMGASAATAGLFVVAGSGVGLPLAVFAYDSYRGNSLDYASDAGTAALFSGVAGAASAALGAAGGTAVDLDMGSVSALIAIFAFCASAGAAAASFVGSYRADSSLGAGKVFWGALTGAALSAAMMFGVASYGHVFEKPGSPAPASSAVERTIPAP